jgi:hypothetical protein
MGTSELLIGGDSPGRLSSLRFGTNTNPLVLENRRWETRAYSVVDKRGHSRGNQTPVLVLECSPVDN